MKPEYPHQTARRVRRILAVLAVTLVATGLAGCESLGRLSSDWVNLAGREFGASDATEAVVAYHRAIRGFGPAELARETATLAHYEPTPINQVRKAVALSHPQGEGGLAHALEQLEKVIASERPEARALHPVARLLADQLHERQRLQQSNDELARQLEASGQLLEESRRGRERLQEKLDALTEIERTLPARPPATASPPPANPERRNTR